MKKQLMRIVRADLHSRFFKAAALVMMLMGSSYFAGAQVTRVSTNIERHAGVPDAQISHLGASNGMLTFEVKVNNITGERFRVLVKDVDGTVLFQGAYDDKNFSKRFVIPKPESNKLIFVVRNSEGNKSQSFEINSSTRVVEDIEVKKI